MKTKLLSLTVAFTVAFTTIVGGTVLTAAPAVAAPGSTELQQAVSRILSDTNAARANLGLPPLKENTALDTVAQNWSQAQSVNKVMTHNPDYTTQIPQGWTLAAENVASGYTPDTVVAAWLASPGHYSNIMSNSTDIGIGYYYGDDGVTYFTQNFANYPTSVTVPSKVSQPAVIVNGGSVTVKWAAPSMTGNAPITSYDIKLTVNGVDKIISATGSSYVLTGLVAGQTYTVQVRAVNKAGGGAYSATQTFVAPASPPTQPTVNVTAHAYDATVGWIANDNGSAITSYDLVVDGYASVNITASSFFIPNLKAGRTYTGTIKANNAVGASPITAFTFKTLDTVPSAPLKVTASSPSTGKITAQWNIDSNSMESPATKYHVVVTSSDNRKVNDSPAVASSPFTLDNLVAGQYTVSVASVGVKGESSFVSSAKVTVTASPNSGPTFRTLPKRIPGPPTNVKTQMVAGGKMNVTWTASRPGSAPTTSYKIYVTSTKGTKTYSVSPNVNSYTVTGLTANTTYTVAVTAINSVGESAKQVLKSSLLSAQSNATKSAPLVLPGQQTKPTNEATKSQPSNTTALQKMVTPTSTVNASLVACVPKTVAPIAAIRGCIWSN